ncbi:hypothetical protein LTR97_002133 [Elasticomyces elasticus]|uniref:Multicopper oxidase n=1 Tax=Elasticomyces elasticus TaxID=574655 RepID=A0AAN7WAE6_9PEZI|nr:hypothetical protein LTR97_002133 [Elasticomyces elasticus]
MRSKTLQFAALAAGAVAAPSNQQNGRQRRQISNDTTAGPSSYGSTTTLDLSTVNTVYTTINVTLTTCTESSSCSASSTEVLSSAIVATTTTSTAETSTDSSSSSSDPTSTTLSSSTSIDSSASSTVYTPYSSADPTYSPLEGTTSISSSAPVSATYINAVTTSALAVAAPAPACTLLPGGPITNDEQVGDSTWGTLCQPYFPQWLGEYPTVPWGENRTVNNSDATIANDIPITNVTRYYNFTVSRGEISPDGVLRDVITINNQFPGPAIEANWGDWIEVKVTNNISNPFEGTALHWHGQLQKTTPWEDGVPSAGQCPIAPGHTYTYRFQAELHGTSWYHAHYSAQFTAGVQGPMVIHGPSSLPYDIDVGPVMLSDWYHVPYFSIVADAVGTNYSLIPPTSDAVLINGRGQFNCSKRSYDNSSEWLGSNLKSNISWTCVDKAPLAAFRFQRGKVHRLRLINTGANGVQKFSLDNHNLTVISTDYVPLVPYTTDVVTLGVGQRTDVLVYALDTPDAAIWMRASLPGGQICGGVGDDSDSWTVAAVYYNEADTTKAPTSKSTVTVGEECLNDPLNMTIPAYPITPSTNHWTQDLELSLAINDTGEFEFRINDQGWRVNLNTPLLPQIAAGNFTFEREWNVYYFYENTSIILNITNNMPLVHPFHMHGHNFYVLNVGDNSTEGSNNIDKRQAGPRFLDGATWDGSVINPTNPMRRDGILIPPYGFAAIQFELDNPGVWPFHCHVAWHLSGGQGLNIAYMADQIPAIPEGLIDETCVDWNWYSANNGPVDQIDSGA